MISTIKWHLRGINTQGVVERHKILKKMHHLSVITILETFCGSFNVHNFKIQLGMENIATNCNGKIPVFFGNGDFDSMIIDEDEYQITCHFSHNEVHKKFSVTFVNAKCKDHLRRLLCDKLLQQDRSNKIHGALWEILIL